jgi:hypothetical protein
MRHVWTSVRSAAGLPAAIPSPAEWGNAMDSMERSQAAIVSSGGWTAGPSNLLEVLGMERAEVANCQVVRWLWDPAARHGLGAELLARLAAHLELRLSDPTSVRVRAEVTKPDSRADLVLYGLDDGELIVEAKVDAAEQPQQGLRLEEDWPNAAGFVFLTIRGDRLPWTAIGVGSPTRSSRRSPQLPRPPTIERQKHGTQPTNGHSQRGDISNEP